jgi:hypothetical protein
VIIVAVRTDPVLDAADVFDSGASGKHGDGLIVVTFIFFRHHRATAHRDGTGYGDAARRDNA